MKNSKILNKSETLNKNELRFIPIGGCREIGMNLYAYIYNDEWILVDMGMGFDDELGKELLVPSPETLLKNKSKIKALFITHSHEDHIGAIPYLWTMIQCPIYGRSFAVEMIREKLSQFGLEDSIPLVKINTGRKIPVGNFEVEFIPVAHSTPESSALAITTPAGTVLHTGDWRLDDDPVLGSKTDEEKLKEYGDKGILALIGDSTNVFRELQYGSEKDVRKNLIEIVKKYKNKRIFVTCFASNLARLETCAIAAKESGRLLVAAGRSIKKIEKIARLAGYLQNIPPFLDSQKINSLDSDKVLVVCTGSQGEKNSALSKMSQDTHKFIKFQEGDLVIFSSRVIPGNELDVLEIQNAITNKQVEIITELDYEIHASGHPSKEELKHLYSLVRPNYLIPVHGETLQLHKHAEIAEECGIKNVIIPKDGCIIKLSKDNSEIIGEVKVGILAVDGTKLIPIDGVVYKERKNLSVNGAVSAVVSYSKGSVKMIDLSCYGVLEESEQEELENIKDDIASEIKLSLENIINIKGKINEKSKAEIQKAVEKIIRTSFIDARGKKPVAFVHVVNP